MTDVDEAGAPAARGPARRTEATREAWSLNLQARLVALACVLVDGAVFVSVTPHLSPGVRTGGLAVVVVVDLALALPTRWSGWTALAHAAAAVGLALAVTGQAEPLDLVGTMIAAYRAGAWLGDRASAGALVALSVGGLLAESSAGTPDVLTALTEAMKDAVIPWMVGRYTSARRSYISELRHNREMELRDATAAMEKAAGRMRTSIARDLHDVISHHVSAIGVHAGAARMRLAAGPAAPDPEVMASLAAVESSSRHAMVDLRRVLDLLHHRPGRRPGTAHQPGLDDLDELLDGVRRSGLPARLEVRGTPGDLAGSVDVALYRIAQEMLTNALRYGDGSMVELRLDFGATDVTLTARNRIGETPERGRLSTGRGLAGIRGQAAVFGGTVTHGPDPAGRHWEVSVRLPYDASASKEPAR